MRAGRDADFDPGMPAATRASRSGWMSAEAVEGGSGLIISPSSGPDCDMGKGTCGVSFSDTPDIARAEPSRRGVGAEI